MDESHRWACRQVLTELVGDAFDATGVDVPGVEAGGVAMTLLRSELAGEHLVVEVRDGSVASPRAVQAGPMDEGGRGLLLADSLASGQGAYPVEGGKGVWAAWGLP